MKRLSAAVVSFLLAAAIGLPLVSAPASAATTNLALKCEGNFNGITQDQDSSMSVNVVAPASVNTGATFAVNITVGPGTVPSTSSGVTINSFSNEVARFPIPAGTSFVSASLSGGSGLGSGTPTVTSSGGNIVLSMPGPMPGGTTFTPPTITANLTATAAGGSTIATTFAGTSYANPGSTFDVNLSIGTAHTSCYATPNPALSSTSVNTPLTVPGAPTIGTASAGSGQANLSWTAPASNGGSAITGYVVTPYIGTTAQPAKTFNTAATAQIITGLANGSPYSFKVAAINAIGTGAQSAASNVVTPNASITVPGAPTIGAATPGAGSVNVHWTAPASDGGSPITGYAVTPYIGATPQSLNTFNSTATSQLISGLTNGTPYTFKVAAINGAGTGPQSSASAAATPSAPLTPPGAPTIGSAAAGDGKATVTWLAPVDTGGSAISGYTVTPYVSGVAGVPVVFASTATAQQITGLTNGTTYTFRVAATNGQGTGPQSADSNGVTPAGLTSTWTPSGGCGAVQTQTVPINASAATVTVAAGHGGQSGSQASSDTVAGGGGGQVVATVPVTPGSTISAVLGCNGADGGGFSNSNPAGGYSAGGTTGRGNIIAGQAGASGGTGAGSSAVCQGASCSAGSSTPLVVAGGGGGGGVSNCAGTPSGPGGAGGQGSSTSGGGGAGNSGNNGSGGGSSGGGSGGGGGGAGGVNSSGGSASGGTSPDGSGGLGVNVVGGGGGGGYVGGAAGGNSNFGCKGAGGGGGGSSWAIASASNVSFGSSNSSAISVVFALTPIVTVPAAPTIGPATAGNHQATVTWAAPADDGGSPITGYVVRPYVSGVAGTPVTFNSVATSQVMTGLTNGTAYTFRVAAKNSAGTGAQSAPSNTVTPAVPATVPGAPTIGTATAGVNKATVTWTAPASNGGSAITGYSVTPYIGAVAGVPQVFNTTATSEDVSGLVAGTTYTFKVAAINGVGTGPLSAASNAVTVKAPPVVPGAPTIGTATVGDNQATVSWTAPASDGGAPITAYVVTPYIGGVAQSPQTFNSNGLVENVAGLVNGTTYTFKVAAINSAGTGPQSAASNAVTPQPPVTSPGAPTIGGATAGNAQATLSWTAPASDGGSAVTGYIVTPYVGATAVAPQVFGTTATTQQIVNLVNGTTYTFKVAAMNAIGSGPQSGASNAVTPTWGLNPTQRFVYAAYSDFLNRYPTTAELNAATSAIIGGTQTRGQVVTGLANSPEWASAIVRQMYVDTLGRTGDPVGITFWATEITSHHRTVAEVAGYFYASPEYYNGIGGGTVDSWLTDLYHKLLKRDPDANGLAFWENETATTGRTSVAIRFFQSNESCQTRVKNLYQKLLGRAADQAGLDYWTARLPTQGDVSLAAYLAASTEYYVRAQSRFP